MRGSKSKKYNRWDIKNRIQFQKEERCEDHSQDLWIKYSHSTKRRSIKEKWKNHDYFDKKEKKNNSRESSIFHCSFDSFPNSHCPKRYSWKKKEKRNNSMKSRDYLFERKKREFFLFSFQFLFSTTINHIFYLSVEEMFARIVSKVNVNRLARFAHTEAKQVEQKMFSGVCTVFCSRNVLIVFVIL